MRLLANLALTVAAAGASAVLYLIELEYWHPRTKAPGLAAISTLGAIAVWQGGSRALRQYRAIKSAAFRRMAGEALAQAFLTITKLPGLSIETVGISAWLVQREGRPPFRRRLVRVNRHRLATTPLPSRIRWTRGKGIIGRCWELENVVAGETATAWQPYLSCKRREWRQVHNSVRLRLPYREFCRIRGKYEGAIAVPILDGKDRFAGCVSVDVRLGANWSALARQEVVDRATEAGATIGNLLAFVSRWIYTGGG